MFLNSVFRQQRFLWFFGILSEGWCNFKKMLRYLFSFWKLYDRFFLYYISADKPQSSLSLKSIVTVELAAQNAHWSNFTSQCNANVFVKVDAQIEEECRRTTSYLQGYSCPKLHCKKLSTIRNTRRTTQCWMRGRLKELLFIKVTVFLPFS